MDFGIFRQYMLDQSGNLDQLYILVLLFEVLQWLLSKRIEWKLFLKVAHNSKLLGFFKGIKGLAYILCKIYIRRLEGGGHKYRFLCDC